MLIEFSLTQLIFIQDKLDNLEKYIKLVYLPAKTRTFTLPPHYKLIQPKREQNDQFQKELAVIFIEQRHNTETLRNRFPIFIYQKGLSYKPYFIVVNMKGQVIIGSNKKIVATYIIGKLILLN